MAGMPFLRVCCQRLYISSEGRDIPAFTLGGLVKVFIGTGLTKESSLAACRFSFEVKSVSTRLRHLELIETYLSGIVGWSLSPARMLAKELFVSLSFLKDLRFSLEPYKIRLFFKELLLARFTFSS